MSHTGGHILRRAASFSAFDSPQTPVSPLSPFSRSSSSKSASSFGCSDFPSCIHWHDQVEGSDFYEMLHFHDDEDHVHTNFHGSFDLLSIDPDEDFMHSSPPIRHESLDGVNSDSVLESHTSPLLRRTSAPPELSAHASETKITRLIRAFQRCSATRRAGPSPAIHLILRGIELKQPASELLSKSLNGHDICVLDIAPRVKFDSDSKSYVHCRLGKSNHFPVVEEIMFFKSIIQAIAIPTWATTACILC